MRSPPRCGQSFRLLDDAPCSQDRTRIIANGDEFRQPICSVGEILQECDTPDQAYGFLPLPQLERHAASSPFCSLGRYPRYLQRAMTNIPLCNSRTGQPGPLEEQPRNNKPMGTVNPGRCAEYSAPSCLVLRFGHKREEGAPMSATVWQCLRRRGSTIHTRLHHIWRLSSGSDTMGSAYLLCREQSMLTNITDCFTGPEPSVSREKDGGGCPESYYLRMTVLSATCCGRHWNATA
jgi:hypothetical protein